MKTIAAPDLRRAIDDGRELALIDVREEGTFGQSHLLLACCIPLSRLEASVHDLVPRPDTRIVLCDADDGLAERAGQRLAELGYTDVARLEGGIAGWKAAGFELFSGLNVPSKAFGEFVEHEYGTPSVSAEELKAMMDSGANMVVLDSRPMDEFNNMSIPTGTCCPGAELAYRVHDVAPDKDTLVVVNCAGRTRSIIGAQSLINAGIPNRVVALRNGTMGWHLAGLEVARGESVHAPEPTATGLASARAAADRVRARFGVKSATWAQVAAWRAEPGRTTYVFDVRSPEEYAAGHLPGSVSAPGGQLVQATDRYAATRGARIVLVDDTGVRATMTASWLVQMEWEVYVLEGGLPASGLETGERAAAAVAGVREVSPQELVRLLDETQTAVLDLGQSLRYRRGHIPGAWWGVRARLKKALDKIGGKDPIVLTSDDGVVARLAAAEAATLGRDVRVLAGGTRAWAAAGLPLRPGTDRMTDVADDLYLRAYDRDEGVEAAMKEYLTWEIDLVNQIERDGTARFKTFPA